MFTRRDMIKGLMLTGGFCLLPLGGRGWALAAPEAVDRHMVVILMRGAVDGLSIVTPYMDQNYYNMRPDIAIAPPGQTDGLLNLDGFFGLNPSLASIMPLWQNRSLAFIQASGSPATTRSHFEAQDILETALLNSGAATQGWMNGMAQVLPDNHSATRAMSVGNVLPKIFQGHYNVASMPSGMKGGKKQFADNPQVEQEFGKLYGSNSQLGGLYSQGVTARENMSQDLQNEMEASGKGAPGAQGFAEQTQKVAEMISRDKNIQLVFMDVGGWDTHVGQGNAKGQLSSKLEKLGEGLSTLAQGLGDEYRNTVVLIMSEFGRTVAQNGNKGTDHGHGNVAWLMGGGVRGGKVYSRWPGLSPDKLYEGRDLAVTTDFRSIIGMTVNGHFGLGDDAIARFIPGYKADAGLRGIVV